MPKSRQRLDRPFALQSAAQAGTGPHLLSPAGHWQEIADETVEFGADWLELSFITPS
jgi:hypothetical protein